MAPYSGQLLYIITTEFTISVAPITLSSMFEVIIWETKEINNKRLFVCSVQSIKPQTSPLQSPTNHSNNFSSYEKPAVKGRIAL